MVMVVCSQPVKMIPSVPVGTFKGQRLNNLHKNTRFMADRQ
jgi:hypothetical protein